MELLVPLFPGTGPSPGWAHLPEAALNAGVAGFINQLLGSAPSAHLKPEPGFSFPVSQLPAAALRVLLRD